MSTLSVTGALRLIFQQLPPARRRAVGPLLALMLAGAVAEVVAIGAIVPFLALIAAPQQDSPVLAYVRPLLDLFGSGDSTHAVYVLACLFALAALLAGALRLKLLWVSQSFVNGISYDMTVRLYANALHEPYIYHTQRNSGEIIAAVRKAELVTYQVLMPLMQGAIALVIATFIVAGLIAIDPAVALIAGLGFSAIYLLVTTATRSGLKRNSTMISRAENRRVKTMQEGLGGVRDVLLDQSQPVFVEAYERAEADYRQARIWNAFFAQGPRYAVEAAGMIMIALIAVMVTRAPGGLVEAIPVLGALAIGAQRLLPLIQQVYMGWAQTMGSRQVLLDVAGLLQRSPPAAASADTALPFETAIRLDDVGFSYAPSRAPALRGVNLEIRKGSRVGIAGKTGSGKSTLMDLILGLLEPTEGKIIIDGVVLTQANRAAWQRNVAHVPQAIYLADATITENIAFGVKADAIDHERVRRAAEQAELAPVIAALPEGYDSRIGERGIQLSGGQRQRIGIARALYKRANVLVFDEATSALDTETESAVMEAIGKLARDLTILIIAHRLSTLEGCDMIVRLDAGRVAGQETGWQLIGTSAG